MIHQVYAVKDAAVETFLQPIFSPSQASAYRALGDAVNDPGHAFNRHTEYYKLFHLGSFCDQTGSFSENDEGPQYTCDLAVFKQTPAALSAEGQVDLVAEAANANKEQDK